MPRLAFVLVLVLIPGISPATAQTPELELQGGAGYVWDSGEGPSVPSVTTGVVVWLTSHVGIAGRLVWGIGNDHYDPPIESEARIFFGPGSPRMWTATVQRRWFTHGTELSVGVGWFGHSYEYQEIVTGILRADWSVEPLTPMLIKERSPTGSIASEFLIGRRLAGSVHIKGGFTYGLADDIHPFQPLVLFIVKAR